MNGSLRTKFERGVEFERGQKFEAPRVTFLYGGLKFEAPRVTFLYGTGYELNGELSYGTDLGLKV